MAPDWRRRLSLDHREINDMSADSMAFNRIMKVMGAAPKDLWRMCDRFSIRHDSEDEAYMRKAGLAFEVFKAMYQNATIVEDFDVRGGRSRDEFVRHVMDEWASGLSNAIMMFRVEGRPVSTITAFAKGLGLSHSPFGDLVVRPGATFVHETDDGVQVWERDPVSLLCSIAGIDSRKKL